FYLSPILYPLDRIPPQWAWIVKINPLAPLLEAYHRILLMNQPPQWGTLAYPLVLGVGLLVYGYWRFKAHERFLADFI
ncbi:MAG: ABC transporter permease, partial [Phototrophicaceae bacterium]